MSTSLFSAKATLQYSHGSYVIIVKVFVRIEEIDQIGLSANTFAIDLDCVPAVIKSLKRINVNARRLGRYSEDIFAPSYRKEARK